MELPETDFWRFFHLELFQAPVISRAQLLHYPGLRHPNPHPILTFHKADPGQAVVSFPQIIVIVNSTPWHNVYICHFCSPLISNKKACVYYTFTSLKNSDPLLCNGETLNLSA